MPSSEARPVFSQGDVIKVPFPYTDRATRQRRPALVISTDEIQRNHGLLWVLMITSAEHRSWPGDLVLRDLATAGLPAPSVIRTAKIATIEARDVEPLGRADPALVAEALASVSRTLGLSVRK